MKIKNNIKFNLHESDFLDYKIEDKSLTFRVGINPILNENLTSNNETYTYIYDIKCYNYEIVETCEVEDCDLRFADIACFEPRDDKYLLALYPEDTQYAHFIFKASSIEWTPIIELTVDDFENDDIINKYFFEK